VPEIKELVTESKEDLLHKIVSSLLVEDRLTSVMCVHKGKVRYLNTTANTTYFGRLCYHLWYKYHWTEVGHYFLWV
jgi:hypothetical protein